MCYKIAPWATVESRSSAVLSFSFPVMKKIFRSFTFLAAALLVAFVCPACSGDDDPVVDDVLTVSPATATIGQDGGTLKLSVQSSHVPTVTSSESWITTGSRGTDPTVAGAYTFTMNVQANLNEAERTATLTVISGSQSKNVQVTQSAADVLKVEPTTISIDDQEQTFEITITTNGVPQFSVDAGWITQTAASSENKRGFKAEANTGAARTATLTYTLGKLTATVTVKQAQAVLTGVVDPSVTYQTMEGFAASDCWAPAVIGKYWTSKRDGIAELLFSREVSNGQPKGIGLSMWRSNLGGGSAEQGLASNIGVENGADGYNYYRRGESYLNDDLSHDWSRCEGQRFFLDKAKDYGVESVVLFSNSPNVQFTRNGKGYSDSGHSTNLKADCYDDFAGYMAKVAAQYIAWGYPVTHISPVNEPQYAWEGHDQEGSGWTNAEIAKLSKELDGALDREGLANVKILLGEAGDWEHAYKTKSPNESSNCIYSFFNASSDNYVGNLSHMAPVYGAHSYWTDGTWNGMRNVRQQAYDKAAENGISLWQTEWSMLGDGYSEFPGYGNSNEMDIALVMDKVIYNDLTVGNMTSWSFWTSMDVSRWSQLDRFMLIDFTPSGGTYSVDLSGEGTYKADATLWVLGNYSLFVRPGFKRIDVDIPNYDRTFFGTGFISPDGKRIVVVMSNLNAAEMEVRLSLKGVTPTTLTSYTTTQRKNLQQQALNASTTVFKLEGSSVTTFVFDL